MSETDGNTQDQEKAPGQEHIGTPPTVLLRFRKPLIFLAHLVAFAFSLLLSFVVANNINLGPPVPARLVENYTF